jgi:signal peptidase
MSWWRELSCGLRRPMLVVGCTFLTFMLAVGAMATLLGTWPPFMAVESRSMQHNDNRSSIGVIDTGDVVVASGGYVGGEPRTYLGSLQDDYKRFGDFGDVVIYQTPGQDVPIVHRAICELVYNSTSGGFDMPELAGLPADEWTASEGNHAWRGLTDWVEIYDVGYANVTVRINLGDLLDSMGSEPYGGLVTMGDNNWREVEGKKLGFIDQGNLVKGPIKPEWIVGKVVSEVPWVGTIRLWLTGTAPSYMPVNSVVMLLASITSIAALPAALWISARALEQRRLR